MLAVVEVSVFLVLPNKKVARREESPHVQLASVIRRLI